MRAATLTALLCLLASPAALAAAPPVTVTTGLSTQVVTDRSWDLVDTNDHLPMAHLAAGWAFGLEGSRLELTAGFLSGTTRASLHRDEYARLWLRGLEVGATLRYPWRRWLEPYARLAAGFDWATLSIGDDGALEQRVWRPSATALVGAALPVVTTRGDAGRRDWLLVDVGVGYTLRPAFAFDALQPVPPDRPPADAIAQTPVDAGRLSASGLTWRVGLTLRL